jgi:hypothetical protein
LVRVVLAEQQLELVQERKAIMVVIRNLEH